METAARRLLVDTDLDGGLLPERVIGNRYRVLRPLKKGQGTETWLATDLTQGSTVVIKTAVATLFSASARMRIEHEAHVLSRLKNGQFEPLLDFGADGDQVYLVMPFIPGITLQARLRQGPLSIMETLTVGRALLSALGRAHALEVLHRDVKPANLIVDEG